MAHADVVSAAAEIQPEWSVNGAALAAGMAALKSPDYVEDGRRLAAEARAFLCEALAELDFEVVPGAANFILLRTDDATGLRLEMLKRGIALRDCTSFGLPDHVRIGMRLMPDCKTLVAAFEALRKQGFGTGRAGATATRSN